MLTLRPRRYAVSMLRSQRDEILAKLRKSEEAATASVEKSAVAVMSAKLDYLRSGLEADWATAKQMTGALFLIEDEEHLHTQMWMRKQEAEAVEAVSWYCDKKMRMHHIQAWGLWKSAAFDFLKYLSEKHAVRRSDIYTIVLYDLNCPYARTKIRVKNVAQATSVMHSDHKSKSVAVIHLTDTT